MRIEIEDSDTIVAQLARLSKNMQNAHIAAKLKRDMVPEAVRCANDLLDLSVADGPEICRLVLAAGVASSMFTNGRCPNSVLCLNKRLQDRGPSKLGEIVSVTTDLPIGTEVLAMLADPLDGPKWDVIGLYFGTYTPLHPCGQVGVSLSQLLCLTTHDVLSSFAGKKTKADVRLSVSVRCKEDGATFNGYSVFVYNEETDCSIVHRLEPSLR